MTKYSSCFILLFVINLAACNNNADTNAKPSMTNEAALIQQVKKYPDSLLLKENLIQYYRENGNYQQAIAEATTALKKDSLSDRLWDIKAILHFENADTLNAISSFERAVDINPQPEYILSLGSLYAQTKNPLALSLADALLMVPKANAGKEALFIKGLYYSYAGDKIKAIPFFDKCLEIDYRDLMAYREKSICLYDLGKYKEALVVLERAITIQKSFDEGYYWMGRCYQQLNQPKEAIANYQQALQIDPDYLEAKDALGKMGVVQ